MKKENQDVILSILGIIIGILIAIFTFVMINFYNDYKCSTTDDAIWYAEHQCYRFNK